MAFVRKVISGDRAIELALKQGADEAHYQVINGNDALSVTVRGVSHAIQCKYGIEEGDVSYLVAKVKKKAETRSHKAIKPLFELPHIEGRPLDSYYRGYGNPSVIDGQKTLTLSPLQILSLRSKISHESWHSGVNLAYLIFVDRSRRGLQAVFDDVLIFEKDF